MWLFVLIAVAIAYGVAVYALAWVSGVYVLGMHDAVARRSDPGPGEL